MTKRLFDLLFASIALLVLLPLLCLIAIAIKLDSPGPVLFRQTRMGRHGRPFSILKFRTMRPDAPGFELTVAGDSRITRMGACLRKYKLDELPQFLNVLLGQMSIVGPRPEVPKYVALYPEIVRDRVLSVRPGITDLASIAFRNESEILARSQDPEKTYADEVLPIKLKHYLEYVERQSFLLDLRIVGKTIRAILC